MNGSPTRQKGASVIVNIIVLALVAYGGYVGIQYIPQFMESKTIDSILKTIDGANRTEPVDSAQAVEGTLVKLLQSNEMNNMSDSYTVRQSNNRITITFSYDRDLDLIYKVQPMHYEKKLALN